MSYPKYLYSEKGAALVKSEAEEKALGKGYFDSPDKCKKAEKLASKSEAKRKDIMKKAPAKKKAKAKKKG